MDIGIGIDPILLEVSSFYAIGQNIVFQKVHFLRTDVGEPCLKKLKQRIIGEALIRHLHKGQNILGKRTSINVSALIQKNRNFVLPEYGNDDVRVGIDVSAEDRQIPVPQ